MNVVRAIALGLVTAGFLLGLTVLALVPESSAIVRAYGIVSRCGVHAAIVVRADGSSEMYTAELVAPPDVQEAVAALPEAQRIGVLVPCVPELIA